MRRMAYLSLAVGLLAGSAEAATLATPPGVTVQPVRGGMIYADAAGKTLYTRDDSQACAAECLATRQPLLAPAGAAPVGHWTLAARQDGASQWALMGKPVFTFSGDQQPGEVKGAAEQWRAATFAPVGAMDMPQDVAVREAIALPGQILVNAKGFTLYTGPGDCTGKCADTWMPVAAAAIAGTVGDFTAVKRADGLRQWAYKGAPLYTYAGDLKAGDMKGSTADAKFKIAALVDYFMPEGVAIREIPDDPIHPMILTTADGRALYAREKWTYTQTFHAKDGDRGPPAMGRTIGTKGCEGECLAKWKPLAAAADAAPSGHWTIFTRDDGTKQWAYQGYALYTYVEDTKPGEMRGNELFGKWEDNVLGPPPTGPTSTASVMFWRVAAP